MDNKAIVLLKEVFIDQDLVENILWAKIEYGDGGYIERTEKEAFFDKTHVKDQIISFLDNKLGKEETDKVIVEIFRRNFEFPLQFIYDKLRHSTNT